MISLFIFSLMLVGSLLGAVGTTLIKKGTGQHSFFQIFRTPFFWWGFFLIVLSTLLYFVALRQEELSVLYPLASLTYVWTTFLSVKYLGEHMNSWKWLGLSGIVLGVVFVGIGS